MTVFDQYASEYDGWFDENQPLFQAEINALKRVVPQMGEGIEIGAGTGRFALAVGIKLGVEPSRSMAQIARHRGLMVCQAMGEQLPFPANQFDHVLLVTVICFVQDMLTLLQEAYRVLIPGGLLINAFIDRNSTLGQVYEAQKNSNKFYQQAKFYSSEQVAAITIQAGFRQLAFSQTILGLPTETPDFDAIQPGYGQGAFVVLSSRK